MASRHEIAPQAVEDAARAAYDACHPDDSFDDLKRRAAFSKEDRCLLRDWLAATERELARGQPVRRAASPSA